MLLEFAVWLATPAPWRFRRLGLLGDSVRLWSRGRRRSAEWAEHERNCHAVVRQAMARCQRYDTVVVLGSGLARDVPLAELCATFRRVILVDAIHLAPLRWRVWRMQRDITLFTRDLTGAIAWLGGSGAGRVPPLADLQADPSIDLVISANVLSQLALPLDDWLARLPSTRLAALPDGRALASRIVKGHLADLAGFAATVCLLTDTVSRERDRNGRLIEEIDLLPGVMLPAGDAHWTWTVAPPGELRAGATQVHEARGYVDLDASLAGRAEPISSGT